ncbi:hypothetical protein IC235_08525 [Hymenobacter sp. BT664]|uniref:Uncharacterized protein n=1 Tax=Hymenobacter montanus TaxID=2771359 RepID=A0A927BDE2_9BACT|nr:hypothetical protein [Hymenobacter montanus]MBD2767938.1 hypothetical protein [Hymenobacter montanus]
MHASDINFDLSSLLVVFDELLPLTDEEQKIYWFKFTRPDRITITLVLSIYEEGANVIVRCNPAVTGASIRITQCTAVRVLDVEKKYLEVISETSGSSSKRCFLSLLGDNIVEFIG